MKTVHNTSTGLSMEIFQKPGDLFLKWMALSFKQMASSFVSEWLHL